mmetsp:Transcript_6616/g.11812  ORF Transcript_6616/g.11812 Transcript_6616/m.11812 type:complete len:297 (+) Transcript_6616:1293-2183(+)
MENSLRPIVVLVTGCSDGGIGCALVHELVSRDKLFEVIATARSLGKMKSLQSLSRVHCLEMDVEDDASVDSAVLQALSCSTTHTIDVLINNAGVTQTGTAIETPIECFQQVFNINLYGTIRVVQKVSPIMIKNKSGLIVNIGSVVGLVPAPLSSAYSASKAAVHAYSDVLRVEMRPFGVGVLVVAPGAIRSNLAVNNNRVIPSKYFPFDVLEQRKNASQTENSTSGTEFARVTIDCIQKRITGNSQSRLWSNAYLIYGYMSNKIRFLRILPDSMRDYFLDKAFKVSTTAQINNSTG